MTRWLYRFVLQYVGPGTPRNGFLAHRTDRVHGGMSSEKMSDTQVFMDGSTSDRKQLIENTVMYRHPVQLSQSGGDVFTFVHCFC